MHKCKRFCLHYMCLKINARPFHPFPETTDKKNSSDLVWLQNWENQALHMIFNLFNKIQALSRAENP